MLFPIQMFTAASSFSVKCFALFVVCVLTPQGSYFIPSPPPEHISPPFSLIEEKPRPRTAPSPHHTYSALCSGPWCPFSTVSLDGQFLLLSYQRLTPPGDHPSLLPSPHQETFLILSPPSLPRLFPTSTQYASALHSLFAYPRHSTLGLRLPPFHQNC